MEEVGRGWLACEHNENDGGPCLEHLYARISTIRSEDPSRARRFKERSRNSTASRSFRQCKTDSLGGCFHRRALRVKIAGAGVEGKAGTFQEAAPSSESTCVPIPEALPKDRSKQTNAKLWERQLTAFRVGRSPSRGRFRGIGRPGQQIDQLLRQAVFVRTGIQS